MTIASASEVKAPITWLLLTTLAIAILVTAYLALAHTMANGNGLILAGTGATAVAIADHEAVRIEGGGFWRSVALTAAIGAVLIGVAIATGGIGVLAYTAAFPAVAATAGISWTAGAGAVFAGTGMAAKGISWMNHNR